MATGGKLEKWAIIHLNPMENQLWLLLSNHLRGKASSVFSLFCFIVMVTNVRGFWEVLLLAAIMVHFI